MRRGGAQREFSLPRSGAERHHACRAQGPPSIDREARERAARQAFWVKVNLYSYQELSKRTEAPIFLLIFLSQTHQILKTKNKNLTFNFLKTKILTKNLAFN